MPAVDSIFMLKADQVVAIEIQELRSPLIGGQIILIQFEPDQFRIVVACVWIVDRNRKEPPPCRIRLPMPCIDPS